MSGILQGTNQCCCIIFVSVEMNHLSISSPSIVDTYSHFVLKGFLLKPFEQKPCIKWAFSSSEGFYLLLKIQNSKLLIQVLTKFTDQPSLFSQNHSLFFLFFSIRIILIRISLYQRDVKTELLQCLSLTPL